ncbi:hypothetical protein V1504DRAFT_459596 [Lipomyces starkeyi]
MALVIANRPPPSATSHKSVCVVCAIGNYDPTRPDDDQYQRALNFLAANEPEQCLRVQLPFEKYEELERNADMAKKYPYVDSAQHVNYNNLYCPFAAAWNGLGALVIRNPPCCLSRYDRKFSLESCCWLRQDRPSGCPRERA